MDFFELHKKAIKHTLVIIFMLLLPATGFAVPQQKNDITKPTRERVKSTDKKTTTDKNTSPDKNSDKNKKGGKTDDKKNDKSPAETAPANNPKDKVTEKTADGDKGTKKEENTNKDNQQAAPEKPKPAPVNVNYDGIDVSKHQGTINWEEVKKDNKIQYVYIKATEGSDRVDERYQENLRNARKAGFKVGSYHYLTNKSSVTTQFKNFATNAPRDQQDLIPVIDVEICNKWDAQQLRDSLKVFANMVEDYYGCRPIIYTYESFFKKYLGKAFADYPIFIAKYSNELPNINGVKWILWQFSESGRVKGITGSVDLSSFNKGCSLQNILYRPAKGKPKISVKDAVDRNKPKPVTVNLMDQPAPTDKPKEEAGKKSNDANSKAKAEQANKAKAEKEKAEREKAEKEKAKADKAKAEKAKAEKAKAEKAKADKEKADKAKAERAKAERERAEKAKAEQDAKNKRKAEAKKAREEKAKQNTSKGTSSKGAYASKLTQSQRNDSIRSAQQSGRKSNKSSADND